MASSGARVNPMTPQYTSPLPLEAFEDPLRLMKSETMSDMKAAEIHNIYCQYNIAHSVQHRRPGWENNFLKENNISAAKLNDAAALILSMRLRNRELDALCWRMLNTASELGHKEATLNLMYIIIRRRWAFDKSVFPHAQARFRKFLAESPSSNILTMEGVMQGQRGADRQAISTLRRALELSPKFEWIASCRTALGQALAREGNVDEARQQFRILMDKDFAHGYLEMAKLDLDHEDAYKWLCKAAVSGLWNACTLLVDMELKNAQDAAARNDMKAREEHLRLSNEWKQIAAGTEVAQPRH